MNEWYAKLDRQINYLSGDFGVIECSVCKKSFVKKHKKHKYCSLSCKAKAIRSKQLPEIKICPVCKKEFTARTKSQKYCSNYCVTQIQKLNSNSKIIKCANCHKEMVVPPYRLKTKNQFCCWGCYCTYQKGKTRNMVWNSKNKGKRGKTKANTTRGFEAVWRKIALAKANNCCEYCGISKESTRLNVHHVISRRNYSVKFYIPNAVVLCAKHHLFSSDFSAHQNSIEFARWILEKRGEAWYNDLLKHKQLIWHNWKLHIDEIREHLQEEQNQLKDIINEHNN